MGKLLMRTGTPSWRTRMPTCKSPVVESLSRRPCVILCDSTAETDCTPDIYRVILLRTAASACRNDTPLRFLTPYKSGPPSPCSAGRQSTATTRANNSRAFRGGHVSARSWAQATRLHRRLLGGGGKSTVESAVSADEIQSSNALGTQRTLERSRSSRPIRGWDWY